MKNSILGFILLFFPFILFSTAAAAPKIKYEGSSTVGLFMKDAAKIYKKASLKISVVTESNGGEICVLAKTCDIGGVARNIHPVFTERGLYAIPFAYDVLTALVNSDNPVKGLTSAQIADIFSGKIKNWKEVGGEDLPITVYIVGRESATRDVFKKHILPDRDYSPQSQVIRPDWRIVLNVHLNRGGIGHVSRSFASSSDQVRPLIIDGYDPNDITSNYPIKRLLHLATFGPPQGHIKDFIEWTTSADGRRLLEKRFFPLEK